MRSNFFSEEKQQDAVVKFARCLTKQAKLDYSMILLGNQPDEHGVSPPSQRSHIIGLVQAFLRHRGEITVSHLEKLAQEFAALTTHQQKKILKGFYLGATADDQHEAVMAMIALLKNQRELCEFFVELARFANLNLNARNAFHNSVYEKLVCQNNDAAIQLLGINGKVLCRL